MTVTAKFKVVNITVHGVTPGGDRSQEYRWIDLQPVYSSDPASPNASWSKATPSGRLQMTITNPAAFEQFRTGHEYLLTFEDVTPTEAAG